MSSNQLGNFIWFYHRQKWMLKLPMAYLRNILNKSNNGFDRPIFMVGLQGAGETLLSRVIKKSPNIVGVSGNSQYWFGPDEMHTVMGPILPACFTGQLHKVPRMDLYGRRRGWAYASNDLIKHYKFGANQIQLSDIKQFRFALQVIQSFNPNGRIFDKSQSYALKIPAIREALKDSNPKFIAVIRNPYVSIYRAATRTTHLSKENMTLDKKIEVATQHWNNTVSSIKEAFEVTQDDIHLLRIEDVLINFNKHIEKIYDFLELDLKMEFLPNENNGMPWWSHRRERWYPVLKDTNQKYLDIIPPHIVEKISLEIKSNADWLGY